MITVEEYLAGHLLGHEGELTADVLANARITTDRTNALKLVYVSQGGVLSQPEVASGWRPKGVNAATSNAAGGSNHITANALDTRDPTRTFAQWCLDHPEELAKLGLYMEDPRWTPTWVHLQTVPPSSGKRVYIPRVCAPLAPALKGQKPIPFTVK